MHQLINNPSPAPCALNCAPGGTYSSFADLQLSVPRSHYLFCVQRALRTVAIVAPHGGYIEPGTDYLARLIAGDKFSLYCFEAREPGPEVPINIAPHDPFPYHPMYLTSTRFDHDVAIDLLAECQRVVSIHRFHESAACIMVGGLDEELKERVSESLVENGYPLISYLNPNLRGTNRGNICNRGSTGKGVQLEISSALCDLVLASREEAHRLAYTIRASFDKEPWAAGLFEETTAEFFKMLSQQLSALMSKDE